MKYSISKEKPVTIRDSKPYGDYVAFDVFSLIENHENEILMLSFKVSLTFMKEHNVDANRLQKIFIEKVTKYLDENSWEIETDSVRTKTICTDDSNPEGIIINNLEELDSIPLQSLIA